MDSTQAVGLLLVGVSGCLLAAQWLQAPWQQCGDWERSSQTTDRWQLHLRRRTRRRTVAGSLVGIVGVTLMAFETVPPTPLSITAYLLALVLMTCWILWLAILDVFASRRMLEEEQLDRLATELRGALQDSEPGKR